MSSAALPLRPSLLFVVGSLAFAGAACGGDDPVTMGEPGPETPMNAVCPPAGPLQPPRVSANLQPPAGAMLLARTRAEGSQIYTCTTGSNGVGYAWSFKAPEAALSDDRCAAKGTHFAGPTWKWTADSSAVVGTKVADAPAPESAGVPWLLLKAASTSGDGFFSRVSAVQRVDTVGGLAPGSGCDAAGLGREISVPYTAVYYFYVGGSFEGGGYTP